MTSFEIRLRKLEKGDARLYKNLAKRNNTWYQLHFFVMASNVVKYKQMITFLL